MQRGWKLERGATVLDDGSVRFAVWAPLVQRASVLILRDGTEAEYPLETTGAGAFEAVVPDVRPGSDYLYLLDGAKRRPDPVSRHQPNGVHGASRVVDPNSFLWRDGNWSGVDCAELILYEVHVGCFSEGGSFAELAERLSYLSDLGVTALQLMPVAEFSGRRNWGYDGAYPYAPHHAYGGPEELRQLIDAAHAAGLAVILDVVYNHLGPEGCYLADFGPYFTDRYVTPWGHAINFDGPDSDEVRRYFVDNALHWVTEYHIDGFRLDAVQAIFDSSPLHILDELGAAVHSQAQASGRPVLVMAESDQNDPRLVRPAERGGYNLDAMWNDDFHHAIHAYLTGERNGYYADFGGITSLAKVLRKRFALDGCHSSYRRRRHGAAASDLPGNQIIVYIQNHDQAGNRPEGERLSALVTLERCRLAAALLLLSPYVPLLFMGEEYGETNPFLYFVDHGDPDLIDSVRLGRLREFARFSWPGASADPGNEVTFLNSHIDLDRAFTGPHAKLLQLYRDLIRLRRQEPALKPGHSEYRVHDGDGWLVLDFQHPQHPLLAAFNLTTSAVTAEVMARPGGWRQLFISDNRRYGGTRDEVNELLSCHKSEPLQLTMPGATAVLYRRESD